MSTLNSLSLIAGGVGLALAILMIVVVVWLDWRTLSNVLNGLLTLTSGLWYVGQLIGRTGAAIGPDPALIQFGLRLAGAGFGVLCVTVYLLAVVLSGGYSHALLWIALSGAAALLIYHLFLSY